MASKIREDNGTFESQNFLNPLESNFPKGSMPAG